MKLPYRIWKRPWLLTSSREIGTQEKIPHRKLPPVSLLTMSQYLVHPMVRNSRNCLLKVAHIAADLDRFREAATIFETAGMESVASPMLKFSAREYFFKAVLCWFFLKDSVTLRQALARYCAADPTFESSLEGKLVHVRGWFLYSELLLIFALPEPGRCL